MARKETVTKIIDGDTFKTDSRKYSVRLANVQAPEKGNPGYNVAKKKLETLIGNRVVSIQTVARDVYGRSVAKVMVGRRSVNKAMQPKKKR